MVKWYKVSRDAMSIVCLDLAELVPNEEHMGLWMLSLDFEPTVEKELLLKRLSNGSLAKFVLVRHQGEYKAMLYLNGKHVNGPPLPELLVTPREDITHWMGNKPGVGLTTEQAEMIIEAVNERNERVRRS